MIALTFINLENKMKQFLLVLVLMQLVGCAGWQKAIEERQRAEYAAAHPDLECEKFVKNIERYGICMQYAAAKLQAYQQSQANQAQALLGVANYYQRQQYLSTPRTTTIMPFGNGWTATQWWCMAKNDTALWTQAKAYFEIGKSLSYIADTLDVDRSTISKRAKREGWIKGQYQHLTDGTIKIKSEISTLDSTLRTVVENDIAERTKHLDLIHNATHINVNRMMKRFEDKNALFDFAEHRNVQATIKDARESLLGKEAAPTAIIHNQNNQANVDSDSAKSWLQEKLRAIDSTATKG